MNHKPPTLADIRTDCRHYIGYKPCGRAEDCRGCADFAPLGPRVLMVKLGALGDVLRTTPLIKALKEQLPGCGITWLTAPSARGLLEHNPGIDRLWVTGAESLARLMVESFDRVICLDKEPAAVSAATLAAAPEKFGYGLTPTGRLTVFNAAAVESLRLGLSDELKFRLNQKTYQRLAFEAAELDWRPGYDYDLPLSSEDHRRADALLSGHSGEGPLIGFNLGGGSVFACKRWKSGHFLDLAGLIADRWPGARILAFGGPEESKRLPRFLSAARERGLKQVIDGGWNNSFTGLTALLARCDAVVSGDSLALHLALAAGSPCLVLIGSTAPAEIELYGRGEMLVTDLDCAPCYGRTCPREDDCMTRFKPEMVMNRLARVVEAEEGVG